jgi:hypothetical protein
MEENEKNPAGQPGKAKAKELIKPRRVEEAYSEGKEADALCSEYGSSSCTGNWDVETTEDDLIF